MKGLETVAMKRHPDFAVQLIRIGGSSKGAVHEFTESPILIGRHPSCHLRFPPHLTIVSRNHAQITRVGNRFKLEDYSTNGTFLNGKRIKQAYLKQGDVLTFAEGGPKVSFIMEMIPQQASRGEKVGAVSAPASELNHERDPRGGLSIPASDPLRGVPPPVTAKSKKIARSLSIQYGPTLRSFAELPITIGTNPACDFRVAHSSILDYHAVIGFSGDRYYVEDVAENCLLMVNSASVKGRTPLAPDAILVLAPGGPAFRFIEGGRLVETELSDSRRPGGDDPGPPEHACPDPEGE